MKSSEWGILIFAVAVGVGAWLVWRVLRQSGWWRRTAVLMNHPPMKYVCAAFLFILPAVILDLGIVRRQVAIFFEELFEMNAGLALLFGSLSIKLCRNRA